MPINMPPIICITDNRSLHKSIYSTKATTEQSLPIDISTLGEMVARKQAEVKWVKGELHLSDVMTKRGAAYKPLLSILQQANLRKH